MSKTEKNQGTLSDGGSMPIVSPDIRSIDELFRRIESGKLRIPAFQRPFVWRPADMIALFESIQRGYPIGSLLLWETSGDFVSRDEIGPIKLHASADQPITYVLDGQQRLSTLFGVLRLPAELAQQDDSDRWIWRIYYDLELERFTHMRSGPIPIYFLPLRAVLRTADYLRFTRVLIEKLPSGSELLIERADRLVQQFSAYRFSLTRIEGGQLAEAVEIFSRLNTRGRPMKPDEMVSALTYREGQSKFHLAQRIDQIMEKLVPFGFGEISRVLVFRTIIASAGEDILRNDWTKVVERLGDRLVPTVERAERAMLRTAEFMVKEIAVPGEAMLPYGYQFVLLSHFFSCCEELGSTPSPGQLKLLFRWFWGTSFSGWFAGANSTQIGDALDGMAALAQSNLAESVLLSQHMNQPARPFPNRFDLHSARVRVLILTVLWQLEPRRLDGVKLMNSPNTWASDNRRLVRVFGKADADLFASPANRLFLPRSEIDGPIGPKRLLELPESYREQVLKSHGIEGEALEALQAGDAARFIKARTHALAEVERTFMRELDLELPVAETGATEIDTDDEA